MREGRGRKRGGGALQHTCAWLPCTPLSGKPPKTTDNTADAETRVANAQGGRGMGSDDTHAHGYSGRHTRALPAKKKKTSAKKGRALIELHACSQLALGRTALAERQAHEQKPVAPCTPGTDLGLAVVALLSEYRY